MTSKIYFLCLLAVALINFVPVIGVIWPAKMSDAYGIDLRDPNLLLLMQHRALLFGIVGGFTLFALMSPPHQTAAMTMAGISMAGFLVLAQTTGANLTVFAPIIKMDILGLALLLLAVILRLAMAPPS